jgi:hypothetical protein
MIPRRADVSRARLPYAAIRSEVGRKGIARPGSRGRLHRDQRGHIYAAEGPNEPRCCPIMGLTSSIGQDRPGSTRRATGLDGSRWVCVPAFHARRAKEAPNIKLHFILQPKARQSSELTVGLGRDNGHGGPRLPNRWGTRSESLVFWGGCPGDGRKPPFFSAIQAFSDLYSSASTL